MENTVEAAIHAFEKHKANCEECGDCDRDLCKEGSDLVDTLFKLAFNVKSNKPVDTDIG